MKINNTPFTSTGTIEKPGAPSRNQGNQTQETNRPSGSAASTVEISENAKFMQMANEAARTAKTDPARLSDLKARIQSGSYQIDSESIADRLVEEHLGSDFGKNNL